MKRRISLLLLGLAMVCALAAPAFADVMWEPYGNSFYEQHRNECSYEDRAYLFNGQKGYVTMRKAPGSGDEVINVPNGKTMYASHRWTDQDGTLWLVGEYSVSRADGDGWDRYEGWIAGADMAPVYNSECFMEDHGAELAEYDGSGDELSEVALYAWPGGQYSHKLTENSGYMPFAEAFQHLYTDGEGRRWSYIGYYMGMQDAWACLDDPMNEDLGVDGPLAVFQVRGGGTLNPAGDLPDAADQSGGADAASADTAPAQTIIPPAEDIPAARSSMLWAIPAGAVALLAAGTAVLAGRMRKKDAADD